MRMELKRNMEDEESTGTEEINDSQVSAHIRGILSRVPQGDTTDYYELVGKLSQSGYLFPDDVALLVTILKGLSGAVTVACIDTVRHETLMKAIFGMSLWNYNPDVMDALVELIIRLATSGYLYSCLDMLVTNFMPHKSFLNELNIPRVIVKKEQVLDRVHSALINITNLMPLAPLRLFPILEQWMPHISVKQEVMAIYVENMLRLESGPIGEFFESSVLPVVVDRLVDLDVEIEWKHIELLENMEEDILDDVYEVIKLLRLYLETDNLILVNQGQGTQHANSLAAKLDRLMVLICQHLKSCAENGRLFEVFEILLKSFYVSVLKTHRPISAQFFMFYACSLDPKKCGLSFVIMLADQFLDNTGIALTRMSSVAYLASYLARAKFLEGVIIANTLERLVKWCVEYCRLVDAEQKTLNPEAHTLFYSGCQVIMYVLCYHMREMLDDPDHRSLIFGFPLLFPLQLIFLHPLDPLKVCQPCVVEEFLKQAKAASLFTTSEFFLFKNLLSSDVSKGFGRAERLDMFFPFDPCLLKNTKRFIKPIFLYWTDVVRPYDDEEDFSAEEQLGDEVDDHLSDDEDMAIEGD
ncbi:hypothetical protein MKW92_039040 [Papaver armeniacum]|nr:hypothetical protein MKW92_039040 [Papaver armeniacum]